MPRIRRIQSSFTAGVLDPRLAARIDINAYNNGAETLDNVICLPQGGVKRRAGTKYLATLHNIVSQVTSGVTATAPNGGVAANSNDDDVSTVTLTTAGIGTTNPYVVVHYDLGSAKEIHYADVVGLKITAGSSSEFFIQYSTDNVTFTSVNGALNVSTSETTERRHPDVSARYWRVTRIGSADLTTSKASIQEFSLFENTGTISETRLIPFSFNTEQNYMLVATDRNITVFKNDVEFAYIRIPFTSSQLGSINWTQSADTLLIVHKDVHPQRIIRNSSVETVWDVDDVPFTNIPQYTFYGGGGAEDVWSDTRGWPISITFFEGRLILGGSKGRPQGIWMSVTNDFYNFNIGTGQPDEAVVGALDTDQVNEIRAVVPGRRLEIFTSGGEFIVPQAPILPENFSASRQTSFGTSIVRTAAIDGATLYIQRNGHSVREFLFSFQEDAHISNSISQLSSHLIEHPVDMAAQKGTSTEETNYIYIVNTAGDIIVLNSLREQDIAAWSGPWETAAAGLFKNIGVIDDEAYTVVTRTIDGVDYNYLEEFDNTIYTDCALVIASHSSATVTGLDHLEGETVKVKVGGLVEADAVVASGQITLDRTPDAEAVEIGLGFTPTIKTMPVSDGFKDGPTLNRKKRIVRATINKYQSLGLFVNGERIPDRQLDVDTFDDIPDPSDETTEIFLHGWSKKAQVTITQTDPVPMTILGIDLEVSA